VGPGQGAMLQPNHPKYRKAFKGRIGSGYSLRELNQGDWGLRAEEGGRVTARQLEAARRSLRRTLQRLGTVWRRPFPALPVSGKPSEVRRGKGKGSVAYWATRIRPGARLFEVGGGVKEGVALEALGKAGVKLPIRTRLCSRVGALL